MLGTMSARRTVLIHELAHKALSLDDPSKLWPYLAKRLSSHFRCGRVTIFQRDASGRLASRYAHGLKDALSLESGEGIAGEAAQSGRPYLTNAPYEDPRFSAATDKRNGFKTKNLLAFPLVHRARSVGVVELINKAGGFKTVDLKEMQAIGAQISVLFVKNRFEEERAELHGQLVQTEKMAALGRLSGAMAHEVNNPLMAILGFNEIVMRTPGIPPQAMSNLLRIDAEVRRIQLIARDLLGFARDTKDAPQPVSLAEIAESTIAFAAAEMKRRRVTVEREFSDAPVVKADPDQMRQVFLNLLLNAAQALEGQQGGTIKVRVFGENGHAVAELADDGPGVPKNLRDKIFEPLFTTKGEKGTGLGLYVSAGIAEKHGGKLSLEPSAKGAIFRLALPAKRDA